MSKYPTSLATLPTISTRDQIGTALVRSMVTEMLALQQDYHNTIGTFSTLASYLSVSFKDDRTIKPSQVSHGKLASVSASQHHKKIHGSAHLTSDAIRLSNDGNTLQKGLMTPQQFNRVKSYVTNAVANKATQANYTGHFGTSASPLIYVTVVQLNFTPLFMINMFASSIAYEFNGLRKIKLEHQMTEHTSNPAVSVVANAITVKQYGMYSQNVDYKTFSIAKP